MTTADWHHPEDPYDPQAWFVGERETGDGRRIGACTAIGGSGCLAVGVLPRTVR